MNKRVKSRGKGEGSISQNSKTGRWVGMVTVGIDPRTCKQIRKSFTAKTRKEVADWINKQIADKKKGQLVNTNKIKLEDWLDQWLNKYKRINVKQTTYDSYNVTIKTHINPSLGAYQLQKLNTDIIQGFINEMADDGLSARTIEYSVYVLSAALKQAIKNKLLSSNPCCDVELPKRVRKQITTLDVDQMLRFKKCMEEYRVPNTQLKNRHHPLYPAFLLMLTTGCRRGEILGLTWENVHLNDGYVSIRQHLIVTSKGLMLETPKTNNSIRDIPLTDKVLDVLRDYKEDKSGLVFTTYKGNYIHPRTFDRSFKFLLVRAGLPETTRLHDLRHTFATQMLAHSVDLKTCSELLGHSTPGFTAMVYVHPSLDMKKKAIAKMNDIINRQA